MIKFEIEGSMPTFSPVSAPEMERIADMMLAEIKENFDTGGRGRWPALRSGRRSTLGAGGKLYQTLGKRSGDGWAEVFGGRGTKYGAMQHFGGVTHPHITKRSQKFFWAMWYQTGDEMWKALALKSIGTTLTISIPARPWMVLPADFEEKIVDFLGEVIIKQEGRFGKRARAFSFV